MENNRSTSGTENKKLKNTLRRLLKTTELNLDDLEQETREAIQEALKILDDQPF